MEEVSQPKQCLGITHGPALRCIIPGQILEAIKDAEDQTQVGHLQSNHPISCINSLAPVLNYSLHRASSPAPGSGPVGSVPRGNFLHHNDLTSLCKHQASQKINKDSLFPLFHESKCYPTSRPQFLQMGPELKIRS